MIAVLGTFKVAICSSEAEYVCEYDRALASTADPASQPALPARRPGGWTNSQVRAGLPDRLRESFDSLDKPDLGAGFRLMRGQAAASGRDAAVGAVESAFAACGRVDAPSVALSAARQASGAMTYDDHGNELAKADADKSGSVCCARLGFRSSNQ